MLQKAALDKYNISKVNFDQIFTGQPPEFPSSKKLIKSSLSPPASKSAAKPGSASKPKSAKKVTPDKKGRQESMDKFLKKTDKSEGNFLYVLLSWVKAKYKTDKQLLPNISLVTAALGVNTLNLTGLVPFTDLIELPDLEYDEMI